MNFRMTSSFGRYGKVLQAGYSMIELLVSITIGLLLMIALLNFYMGVSRSNSEMAKTSGLMENARLAIQVLQNDIAHAGYWGGFIPHFDDLTQSSIPADAPTAIPDPCLEYNSTNWDAAYFNNLIGVPVQAYEDVPATCSSILSDKLANTDVLVVRHVDTCVADVDANCEAHDEDKLYFQVSESYGGHCISGTADATPYVFSSDEDDFDDVLTKKDCATYVTDKRRFISHIYYVRDYAVTSGDGIPTLVRSEFDLNGSTLAHQAPLPLIEGIERFRVELGIDNISDSGAAVDYTTAVNWADPETKTSATNRGDGIPDGNFVHCTTTTPCTLGQLTNVVAVKLYLLSRAREATNTYTDNKTYTLGGASYGPFSDNFKRHVYTTSVRLNNIAGRRETP